MGCPAVALAATTATQHHSKHDVDRLKWPGFFSELFSAELHFCLSTLSDFNYFCNLVQLPPPPQKQNTLLCFSSLAWSEIVFFQPVLVQSTTFLHHPSLLSVPSARRRFTADKHKPPFAAQLFSRPSVRSTWRLSSRSCSIKTRTFSEEQHSAIGEGHVLALLRELTHSLSLRLFPVWDTYMAAMWKRVCVWICSGVSD